MTLMTMAIEVIYHAVFAVWFGGLWFYSLSLYWALEKFPLGSSHSRQFLGLITKRYSEIGLVALTLQLILTVWRDRWTGSVITTELWIKYVLLLIVGLVLFILNHEARQINQHDFANNHREIMPDNHYHKVCWMIRLALVFGLCLMYLVHPAN